jgi:hypothetical protein
LKDNDTLLGLLYFRVRFARHGLVRRPYLLLSNTLLFV